MREGLMSQPRYRELADLLLEQIVTGALPVGSRVPSEHDLCTEHQLSRGTVREALRCLEELGMISRTRLGTSVVSPTPVDGYQPSAATPSEIANLIERTKLLHPVASEITANKTLARRLGVPRGSRWFTLVGPLVLASSTSTLCWSEHYHSTAQGRDIFRRGTYDPTRVGAKLEQVISAELLHPSIADALDAESGSPALVVRRRHFSKDGRAFKVSIHTHRGDRFRVTTMLVEPDAAR
jgi:DNA-binding GntR family transcriptional regulator